MKARIIIFDHGEARVFTPYNPELTEIIKAVPGRKWNPEHKFWSFPAELAKSLERDLRAFGCQVTVDDERTPPQPKAETATAGRWADELLGQLYTINPLLSEKAFTALVRVLHPDLGHDTGRLMQQLNDARAYLNRKAS